MTDRTVMGDDGRLTVMRFPDYNSSLVEVWTLTFNFEGIEPEELDDPYLGVHVAKVSDCNPVPHSDHSVHDSCQFSKAPEEIQDAFIEQLYQLMEVREYLVRFSDSFGRGRHL